MPDDGLLGELKAKAYQLVEKAEKGCVMDVEYLRKVAGLVDGVARDMHRSNLPDFHTKLQVIVDKYNHLAKQSGHEAGTFLSEQTLSWYNDGQDDEPGDIGLLAPGYKYRFPERSGP